MKKFLLTLGSITTIAAPIAAVVSCGVETTTKEQRELHAALNEGKTYDAVKERWQEKVLKANYANFDPSKYYGTYAPDPADTTKQKFTPADIADNKDIQDTFEKLLVEQSAHDHRYLYKTGNKILNDKDFMPGATTQEKKDALVHWGLLKTYTPNGDISSVTAEAKKYILEHESGIRRDVYQKTIAMLYLEKATKEEIEFAVLPATHEFTDKQKMIHSTEFALVNEALSQNLFAKWNISVKHDDAFFGPEAKKFINHADDATMTDADAHFIDAAASGSTADPLFDLMKYSAKIKKLPAGILPTTFNTNLSFYQGISTLSDIPGTPHTGADAEKKTADELKLITDKNKWDGYLYDKKIIRDNIPYFSKDTHVDISFNKVKGLMPVYKAGTGLTFEGTDFEVSGTDKTNMRYLLFQLAKKSSVYTNAVKYFTKRETNPILLEITSDDLRQKAIERGFTFIKEKK